MHGDSFAHGDALYSVPLSWRRRFPPAGTDHPALSNQYAALGVSAFYQSLSPHFCARPMDAVEESLPIDFTFTKESFSGTWKVPGNNINRP